MTQKGWIAEINVFSGRPNPHWEVPRNLGEGLAQRWEALPEWSGRAPEAPGLGYRGVRLESPDGRVWEAFGELIVSAGRRRRDGERHFEKDVIRSAPQGTLPPGLPG
jgi:hypothetical protein